MSLIFAQSKTLWGRCKNQAWMLGQQGVMLLETEYIS